MLALFLSWNNGSIRCKCFPTKKDAALQEVNVIRRTLSVLVLVVVMSVAGSTRAQEPDTKAGRAALDSRLSLIDTANYAKSWDEAATGFKSAVTSEAWQAAVKTARGQFGAFKSRTVKSANPATKLPGAPDGEYMVFQFDAATRKARLLNWSRRFGEGRLVARCWLFCKVRQDTGSAFVVRLLTVNRRVRKVLQGRLTLA
jgi:hypothetical protein